MQSSNPPFSKSIVITSVFLFSLSASTPANGLTIIVGNMLTTSVMAKDNPEPVVFNTYNPSAKVYIALPNNETSFAQEKINIFDNSLLLIESFANNLYI